MPSQVPPGFTRGPILFLSAQASEPTEHRLLQFFWDNGGAYGARIVILPIPGEDAPDAERYAALFRQWESDSVTLLRLRSRADALDLETARCIEGSTAVLLIGESPLRMASVIGGTPTAQAIRRANARSKAVGGVGACAAVLCQHMIVSGERSEPGTPFLRSGLIQFAPGLGLINRLVLDNAAAAEQLQPRLARLLTAVTYNPFLVGVGLEAGTGAVVYPDTTLEVIGVGSALVVEGSGVTHAVVPERLQDEPVSVLGIRLHVLNEGCTFNFDTRHAAPPPESDIPTNGDTVTSAF